MAESTKGTVGIRNLNYLNVKENPKNRCQGSLGVDEHRHTKFRAPEWGIARCNHNQATEIYIDGRPKAKSSLLDVTNESLRLRLDPADFSGKTQIVVTAKNPEPDDGESQPLTISVSQPGA